MKAPGASVSFTLICLLFVPGILPRATAQGGDPAAVGQWAPAVNWSVAPIHVHLLPTGRVMFHGETDTAGRVRLWNPADNTLITPADPGYNLFCSAHTMVPDGRLFYTGGQYLKYSASPDDGLPTAKYYDPFNNVWIALPNMTGDRWYPTNTALGNGDVLVTSGTDAAQGMNTLPQVWQTASNTWRNLTTARLGLPLYPEVFLAPDGRAFLADFTSRILDTSGTGAWTTVGSMKIQGRSNYGSACVYEPGKILFAGGADPPTDTAEVIDLNQPAPAWRLVSPMAFRRRQLNLTLLPDGTVVATGGSSSNGFDNPSSPAMAAEQWDPSTETWKTWASATRYKGYHSFGLLLPSGQVLTGGQVGPHAEIFSPPYLFLGARPTIGSAPATVGYGESFFIGTPDGLNIQKVTLVRLGSVTHSLNMGQRFNRLNFTAAAGGIQATSPANGNLCPPGIYMLFILNASGVPSVGRFIRIGGIPPPSGLPSPWQSQDVGAVGAPGSATFENSVFTVNGSGAGITGTADEFQFVFQQASGDCGITARVGTLQKTGARARGAVMIRETTSANSRMAMIAATPGGTVVMQYRSATGGRVGQFSSRRLAVPCWIRLNRVRNTLTGYRSADGVAWTRMGAVTISMSTSTNLGMAVTAGVDGKLCTAGFSNVDATP